MASDEPMTFQFHSSMQGSNFENDIDVHDHRDDDPHPHSLSRLSVCTNSTLCGVDDDVDEGMAKYMSGLSIEIFEGEGDGDADGELSDGREIPTGAELLSDSENELSSCYPLPGTPLRRRNLTPMSVREYASDNEGKTGALMRRETKENDTWRRKCRRMRKEERENRSNKKEEVDVEAEGLSVMRRRSLCIDSEEVKGCRDLGFDLELEIPSRISLSLSNSAIETSSGATSPIANWRISSPGDDPRDVKARLKMWAQAVAVSASKYGT